MSILAIILTAAGAIILIYLLIGVIEFNRTLAQVPGLREQLRKLSSTHPKAGCMPLVMFAVSWPFSGAMARMADRMSRAIKAKQKG